jgi:hypothetical protein
MQLLYAVDLDVSGARSEADADAVFGRLESHVVAWLDHGADRPLPPGGLDVDGVRRAALTRPFGQVHRDETWRVLAAGDDRALRLETRQPLPGVDASFVCRITLAVVDRQATLRVAMGRDSATGIVSAIPVDHLRRPALLGQILKDSDLDCRVMGQEVKGRWIDLHSTETPALLDAVRRSKRLPLLVIDSSGLSRHDDLAGAAARELAGLAQVVRLRDPGMAGALAAALPGAAAVPAGGARLLWPALDVWHPRFDTDALRHADRTVAQLMRLIAPFAVAARGRDKAWEELGRRARLRETERTRAGLEAAANAGDTAQQVELLEAALAARTAELEEFVEAFGDPAEQEDFAEELAKAQSDAAYWKEQYFDVLRADPADVPWTERVPELDNADVTGLYGWLSEQTDGAIVFTPAAVTSWKKSGYPFPDDMRDALVVLARAACEWREKSGEIGAAPDDWLKISYGVNSAFTDGGMKKFAKFTFDNETYDRTPHLKLDDNTTPDRVGRIYFALDKKRWRFVVDHVGLKLYGL